MNFFLSQINESKTLSALEENYSFINGQALQLEIMYFSSYSYMKEMETNIINLKIFEKNVKEEKILVIIKQNSKDENLMHFDQISETLKQQDTLYQICQIQEVFNWTLEEDKSTLIYSGLIFQKIQTNLQRYVKDILEAKDTQNFENLMIQMLKQGISLLKFIINHCKLLNWKFLPNNFFISLENLQLYLFYDFKLFENNETIQQEIYTHSMKKQQNGLICTPELPSLDEHQMELEENNFNAYEREKYQDIKIPQLQNIYEENKLGIESKFIYYLGKAFYLIFTKSEWNEENFMKVDGVAFEAKTAVGWEKMILIFQEMINKNLQQNASFDSVLTIIEKTQKQEEKQQDSQEIQVDKQQQPNQEQIIQEILPSVIPILPSVIQMSPQPPSSHSEITSDQASNNQQQNNKHPGILIQIKEDRSMCKIHITQPIILICNVCYKLLCIRCLNQHEQHSEKSDSEQYQSLELFIKNELQNQQTLCKLKQISSEYTSKIKEFQKKVTQNVVNFENTFIENLKKTLIDQIDKKKMELIGYLKQNQYQSIEELIKSNEQISDNMNSIIWLFKNFDMIEDVNDVYKFNEFYEVIQKVQLSKVFSQYDLIISSVNERVKELSSSMIMQLLKQFFDNLQRLNPQEADKMNQPKSEVPKFNYVTKEAEQKLQKQAEITGAKRPYEKFMSFKTVKEKQSREMNKEPRQNGQKNGVQKLSQQVNSFQESDVINIEDEEEPIMHDHEFQSIRSMKEQQQSFLLWSGEEEETKKRNSLIQKYKERNNELNQKNSNNNNNATNNDENLNFEFPPRKNVHFESQYQPQMNGHSNPNAKPKYNNNLSSNEMNRKRQELEDELQELKELQQHALLEPPANYPQETYNAPNIQQQQQPVQSGEKPKRQIGRKTKTNTCGHPELPHKSLGFSFIQKSIVTKGKCAKCYFAYRKELKQSQTFNVLLIQHQIILQNSNKESFTRQFQNGGMYQDAY